MSVASAHITPARPATVAIESVLSGIGLRRTAPDSWVGLGSSCGSGGRCSFDAATRLSTGRGLFAKAHVALRLNGDPAGHLKIALTPYAAQAIRHEHEVLAALGGLLGEWVVPVPVAVGCTDNGICWSIQEPVRGSRTLVGPIALRRLTEAMARAMLPAAPYPTPGDLALNASASGVCGVATHGDLIAANTLRHPPDASVRARLAVVDWEWATPTGMPGFDICHYFLGGVLTRQVSSRFRIDAAWVAARASLAAAGLERRAALEGYLAGMTAFYSWCAESDGRSPENEAVVLNAARVRSRLVRQQVDGLRRG